MRRGGNKDSSRQSFIFPSLNSYILHSVNSYQDFVQFVAKRFFYLYANESLMQPVFVFFPSLFVTLSLHCICLYIANIQLGLQSKAQQVFPAKENCRQPESATPRWKLVKNSVCVSSQYKRTLMHFAYLRGTQSPFRDWLYFSDTKK